MNGPLLRMYGERLVKEAKKELLDKKKIRWYFKMAVIPVFRVDKNLKQGFVLGETESADKNTTKLMTPRLLDEINHYDAK